MFDTMKATKIVAGLCGALLILVLGNMLAGSIFSHGGGGHGEGEEHAQGYHIEVEEAEDHGDEEAVEEIDFAPIYAAADAAAGEGLWRNCRSCHALEEGKNGVGPSLAGILDRAAESVDGYAYSGALAQVVDVWSPENLNKFLENPKGFAPGTKMAFKGIREIEDRANLIAYLATH